MFPLIAVILIFGWFIYGLSALNLLRPALEDISKPVAKWLNEPGNPVRLGLWVVALAVTVAAWRSSQESILGKLQGEITGIAITVILIDELTGYRNNLQLKQEIIEQIESPVRDMAVEAVRMARKYGWLDEALKKAKLDRSQLEGANLRGAKLQKANLEFAELQGAFLSVAELQGANLRGANLQKAKLDSVKLQGAFLWNANLQEAILEFANLQEADLWGANMQGADLQNANLQKADLTSVQLQKADLRGANLEGAQLQRAECDNTTLWSEGFAFEAAGVILVSN